MPAPAPGARRRGRAAETPGLAARRAALALLDGVLSQARALDDLLGENDALAALDVRDRGFARLLAATVLRRLGQIDAVLDAFLDRPLPRRATAARLLLRLGAAQILFVGTPPHAAVASTMALAATNPTQPYKGLINAVLRRVAAEGTALVETQDAGRLNTPGWLWTSWQRSYGPDTAAAIARAHLAEAPLDLSLRPDADPALWAERLEARILPMGALRREAGGRIEDLPGFAEGAWWVQDAAASLPARLIRDPRDRVVLDLCAAPGGKTAQLAAAGARVIAVDRSPGRMARVQENLTRLGLSAECVVADAGEWRSQTPLSAILLDAPCSATGTIRRHPDVPFLKRPADIVELAGLQDRLLDAAVAQLMPGGVLIYCVCSLQAEEGPDRIAAVLARRPGLGRVPILPAEIGGLSEAITADGDLRTLPCHLADTGGVDGFYACRLARI